MRISTSTFYDANIASMQQQGSALLKTQQQIASGRRIVTPADDPVAAAQALNVSQAQSLNQQYISNVAMAGDSLALVDTALSSINELLMQARDIVVSAGNPVLDRGSRQSLANDLQGKYQQLLGLANSVDAGGQYLFGGYRGTTQPFSVASPGLVQYNGDQGQRLIEVSPGRQIAVTNSGDEVFRRIATGNGSFATSAGLNSGSAVIDPGTVLDPSKWNSAANSGDLTIHFAVNGANTTYDIIDNASGVSLLTGAAPAGAPYPRSYASGSAISLSQAGPPAFDFGAQVTIAGAPANGDSFAIRTSTGQDVFKTLSDLAGLLQASNGGAALTNGLVAAQTNVDNALQNMQSVQTSVGARLKELDAVKNGADDRDLQYSQTLSRLQDVDYAQASSQLLQQQTNLEAAQKSFLKVSGLSLFNYL